MEKFNNTTLFTGYLKQLLHDFNLPKYRVYTREHQKYYDTYRRESPEILDEAILTSLEDKQKCLPYIRNDAIQEYINGQWVNSGRKDNVEIKDSKHYSYGAKILNYTKNLLINSNAYDSYTHEYLGEYLRFQRDYLGLDLMSLYNCFSNNQCDKLNLNINIHTLSIKSDNQQVISTVTAKFDTANTHYKIYMLPVKFFKEYTVAIDSASPVELCCGIYNKNPEIIEKYKDIYSLTYEKYDSCYFNAPQLFDKLKLKQAATDNGLELNTILNAISREEDLKLFIKVPVENTSTIVVLEGNYIGWNDKIFSLKPIPKSDEMSIQMLANNTTLNFEYDMIEAEPILKSPLQLLQANTKQQHPFADRLIEYLIGNTITHEETVAKNIMRVQKALAIDTADKQNFDLNGKPEYTFKYSALNKDIWDDNIKYIIYDYMTTHYNKDIIINHDILGYVDKDAERYYLYINPKTNEKINISSTEIDEE